MKTLIEKLEERRDTMSVSSSNWTTFVKDHLPQLKENSTIVELSYDEINKYKGREHVLFAKYDISYGDNWIVWFVNNMVMSVGLLSDKTHMYMPDPDHIETLRNNFKVYQKKITT